MKTIAIVPAAGSGKRLGLKVKKPFVLICGRPLIAHTLGALERSDAIDAIMVAVEKGYVKRLADTIKKYGFKKVTDIVVGGSTRYESVRNCLERIGPSYGVVIVHDGARPFIDTALLKRTVDSAKKYGSAIAALPERDTVKLGDKDMFIRSTLDRNRIFRAQTPQAFRYHLIKKAYGLKRKTPATDDSSLLEALGHRVKIIAGSGRNIKITTKEDLKIAEVLLCA